MNHTPTPWKRGNGYGAVVADRPYPDPDRRTMGSDAVEHYGGFLVCESCAPGDADHIIGAAKLVDAIAVLAAGWRAMAGEHPILDAVAARLDWELAKVKDPTVAFGERPL